MSIPYIIKEEVKVLTEDVTNPHGDQRCKHDWNRLPVWKMGTRFMLQTFDLGLKYGIKDAEGKQGRSLRKIGLHWGMEVPDTENYRWLFDLLMPRLADVPETVESVMEMHGLDTRDHLFQVRFIKFLISRGKFTLGEFRALVAELYETEKKEMEK